MIRFLIGVGVGFVIAKYLIEDATKVGFLEKTIKIVSNGDIITVSEGYYKILPNESFVLTQDPSLATLLTKSEAKKIKDIIVKNSPVLSAGDSFTFIPYEVIREFQLTQNA